MGDLLVVSFTEKAKILEALSTLAKRSVYFLGLLISLTFILSMILTRSLTSRLNDLVEATRKISSGDFRLKLDTRSQDEVGSLSSSFQKMTGEIVRLLEETSTKARMEAELATAKAVQDSLFPVANQTFDHLQVTGHYEPASECSGDWWFYHHTQNKYIMCIGDATGHGVPAALITSAARAAFATAARQDLSPGLLLEWMNYSIHEVAKAQLMMTMFIGVYDPVSRKLTYANASHEPTFLIRNVGTPLSKKDLIILNDVNGPRLGEQASVNFEEASIELNPGDTLYFYTDGLIDVENKAGKSLGERAFLKILTTAFSASKDPDVCVANVRTALNDYRQASTLIDDITFFTCQVRDTMEKSPDIRETPTALLKIAN
jgi:sigma-B regulation protein RsbU (phosphoserine phosphatase)